MAAGDEEQQQPLAFSVDGTPPPPKKEPEVVAPEAEETTAAESITASPISDEPEQNGSQEDGKSPNNNNSTTATTTASSSSSSSIPSSSSSDAIDDSEDLDDDVASAQKTISVTRRRQSLGLGRKFPGNQADRRAQEVVGFPFLPNIRPLTISDLECCVALEGAAFSKEHRATREKLEYRLSTCPEFSMGIFCTVTPSNAAKLDMETVATARKVETGREDGALSVLFAYIASTKTSHDLVYDGDMDYPRDFRTNRNAAYSGVGHDKNGNTVALHSLAVHPKLHGCGLGKLIMKAYMQQINNSRTADRISLICQDYLVNYYLRFGFKSNGPSKAQFGGGGWFDMYIDLGGGSPKK